jgi:hypothetical protein
VRVVAGLAMARLRHRPLRRLLVVLGVAAATVLPVVAQASASVAASRALEHAIAGLPAGQRSLIVSTSSVQIAADDLRRIDGQARDGLASLTSQRPRAELLYRRLSDSHGGSYSLGAADDLATAVRLDSGRLPVSCRPTRCEVVVVGAGTPDLDPSLGLVVVGRAVRTDPLLLTGTFDPGHDAPLLLADGVADAQAVAPLSAFQRSYGWVAPLDLALVRALGVSGYVDRSAAVANHLQSQRLSFALTSPDQLLRSEDARATLSARRFALLSGAATALLLGFAVVAAVGLRRDQLAVQSLLRRRGARQRTVRALALVEAAVPVVVGTALGLAAGVVAAAWLAANAGLSARAVAADALAQSWVAVAVAAALAVVVVALTASWPEARDGAGGRTAWRVVDGVVVAGLVVVVVAAARGTVGTASLTGGADPLLGALPVVAVVCGGLLAARLWPYVVTGVGRLLPAGHERGLAVRLGLLGAVRRPLRAVATVAFVTAAVGIVVFAGSYRATLAQGAVDQAAYQVPLDARLTVGPTLDQPLDVASPAAMAALAGGGTAVRAVVRTSASVRVSGTEAAPVEVVGVDPAALSEVASWDHVVGGLDPATAARLLRHDVPARGLSVPPGAQRLDLPAAGDTDQLQLVAWIRRADGRDLGLSLTRTAAGGSGIVFTTGLPAAAGGGVLFAVTMAEDPSYATFHQHAIGEGTTNVAVLSGRLDLAAARFDGRAAGSWTGWGSSNAEVATTGQALNVSYALTGARLVLRADAATDTGSATAPVPALVDPATAARAVGGQLQIGLGVGDPLTLRVVGVVPRFPTQGSSFAVTDVAGLAQVLDDRDPGRGSVGEVWLAAADGRTAALDDALGQAPYDRLAVALRSAAQDQLATDPLAVGASSLLAASALLALAVVVVALVLLVVGERRDDAAELYAWESDGVAPGTLRRVLVARSLSVVAVAVPAGILVGLVLSTATAALVTVTAVGTAATPPLALAVGPGWVAAVLGAALVVAVGAVVSVAAASLREPLPVRPETDLR